MTKNWSEEELKAAVAAYIDMHTKEANGIAFSKKMYYIDLATQFRDRTEKSFEYRMQNISYVFSLMGRNWVSGLKPATNIGSKNAAIIERLICEAENVDLLRVAEFETQVKDLQSAKILEKPLGVKEPEKLYSAVTSFVRDPKVKAWVLKEAKGTCECCGASAPFVTADGLPFLEVHHLRQLADGGSDTVTNAVALCPNCHREMHYGANKFFLIQKVVWKNRTVNARMMNVQALAT